MNEEKLIKIYEENVPEDNSKILLQKLLEENNIPYKGEIKEYWTGLRIAKYNTKFVIYVEEKFKSQAQEYVKEIYNEDNILDDNIKEIKTDENTEDEEKIINKRQKIMQRTLVGIVGAMVLSIIIIAILTG